MKRMDAPFF